MELELNKNLRKWGEPPYNVLLIHGGPGAPGEMAPVAKELSKSISVLEPFQTKDTIKGQIEELKVTIENECITPVVLVGWSWGAWLVYIFAANYPELVSKIIIISSGPFEQKYVEGMKATRLSHLSLKEQSRLLELEKLFKDESIPNKEKLFNEYGSLYDKADSYLKVEEKETFDEVKSNPDIYNKIWPEAAKLRETGELVKLGKQIKCEVVAIHGDYDGHPAFGVKVPLSKIITNFRFILLEKCGHHPWYEKYAKVNFYKILTEEISK